MNNTAKILTVTGERNEDAQGKPLLDKNGNRYKVLEVSTPDMLFTRDSEGVMRPISQRPESIGGITGWEKSNLPSLKGKADYEFNLTLGQDVIGDIVTRQVVDKTTGKRVFIPDTLPYAKRKDGTEIVGPDKDANNKTGRFVDSMRVAVIGYNTTDEQAFEVAVARAFARKGYRIVNQTAAQAAEAKQVNPDLVQPDTRTEAEKQAANALLASK